MSRFENHQRGSTPGEYGFSRRKDALRRSLIRNRTWSPVSSVIHTTTSGKTRSLTQTSPTSPLRQMILSEDLTVIRMPMKMPVFSIAAPAHFLSADRQKVSMLNLKK
jgi:hypothetical protein